jgi:uncharacterized protein (DUF58 family)
MPNVEARQVLIWSVSLAALIGYAIFRPGVWPWLVIGGLLALMLNFAYRKPPQVRIARSFSSKRTFQDSAVTVTLEVRIDCVFPTLLSLNETVPLTLIPNRTVGLTGLYWRSSTHTFEYNVTPNARGGFRWPKLMLSWSDPLGLFERNVEIGRTEPGRIRPSDPKLEIEMLVYPGLHALELPELLRPLLSDGPPTRLRGLEDASTFAGTREYAPGDPLRRIHWRQTARMGLTEGRYNRLIVRELERIAATGLHVHVDQFGSGTLGTIYLESAVRLAASLVHQAFEHGLRVSVSSDVGMTEPGSDFSALERALADLALLKVSTEAQFEIPLPAAGTNLILITMLAPDDLIKAAIRTRSRAAQVLVIALPEGYYLEPGETGRPIKRALPESIRDLETRAGILEEAGVRVSILRGDSSVLKLTT